MCYKPKWYNDDKKFLPQGNHPDFHKTGGNFSGKVSPPRKFRGKCVTVSPREVFLKKFPKKAPRHKLCKSAITGCNQLCTYKLLIMLGGKV